MCLLQGGNRLDEILELHRKAQLGRLLWKMLACYFINRAHCRAAGITNSR